MFNVVEAKSGRMDTFDTFLAQAQQISGKLDSPVSLGPFRNEESRIYIYVTHYASTRAFIGVMLRLTLTLVTLKRSLAIQHTSWTYCRPTNAANLDQLQNVLVVGIQGDSEAFQQTLLQRGIDPSATTESIKNVRGKSLGSYFVLPDTPENKSVLEEFRSAGGDLIVYRLTKLE